MNTQELRDKHLEAISGMSCIYGETPKVDPGDELESAEACTQVSIQFAIDVLERMPVRTLVVTSMIIELKQQLKP